MSFALGFLCGATFVGGVCWIVYVLVRPSELEDAGVKLDQEDRS